MPEENVQQSEEQAAAQSKEQPSELDLLKTQIAEKNKELEKWQRESKAHQATATRASQELKKLRELSTSGKKPTTQLLELYEEQFGADNPKVKDLKMQMTREEQIARQDQIAQDYKSKLQEKITTAGLNPEDEQFDVVWDAYDMAYSVDGKFDRAESRLDRILNKQGKKESKSENNDKSKPEINEEEIARKWLEKKGHLVSETGMPSASGGSFSDIEKKYIKGEVSLDVYEAAAKKAGIL